MMEIRRPASISTIQAMTYSETWVLRKARTRNFSLAGKFRSAQVLEVWILGTPDLRDCKRFPLNKGFLYVEVLFKTGLLRMKIFCFTTCVEVLGINVIRKSECFTRLAAIFHVRLLSIIRFYDTGLFPQCSICYVTKLSTAKLNSAGDR